MLKRGSSYLSHVHTYIDERGDERRDILALKQVLKVELDANV